MDTVYIGIDFGTLNTSVASSNGMREVLQTMVGWPKDHVAREVIGKDVVFGSEIQENRLALEVVRPFERGLLKYQDAAEAGISEQEAKRCKQAATLLLRQAVSLVTPSRDVRTCGVVGVPSRCSDHSKQLIQEIAQEALDAVMLVPEPFAVGYGTKQCHNGLVIDIGAGTIDLCPMFGALPEDEDQLTIPFGGDFIDGDFCQRMLAIHNQARLSLNIARQIKEKHGFVGDEDKRVRVKLPVKGRPPQEFDVTEPLRLSCETMVSEIVAGIHELIWQLDPEVQYAIISNIVLSGGGSQMKGLDTALEQALKEHGRINVSRVCDTVFAGASGALRLAMGMPTQHWNQLQQSTLTAMSVS